MVVPECCTSLHAVAHVQWLNDLISPGDAGAEN